MIDEVTAARDDALTRVTAAESLDELAALQPQLLGKRGALGTVKGRLGELPTDDRRTIGQALNDAVAVVGAAIEERRAALAAGERAVRLEVERLDLTERTTRPSRGHRHLVTQAAEQLEDVFVGMGFMIAEGPEADTAWNSFTALNMPPWHPARSEFDTMFVSLGEPGSVLLRPHTSPVQVRVMQSQPPPIRIVAPGRVYRRDTADATHMPVFHQIEGLVVDRGITFADLAGTIEAFTHAYFGPGFTSRLRPSYFPFTEPSAEFDIQRPDGSWLELGGCGMVHPKVFEACGIDPEEWTGFAFGFGIDRMPLMRHGIDDLRELFTNDVRFLEQF